MVAANPKKLRRVPVLFSVEAPDKAPGLPDTRMGVFSFVG